MNHRPSKPSPSASAPPSAPPPAEAAPAETIEEQRRRIDCSAAADEHGPTPGRRNTRISRSVERSSAPPGRRGDPRPD